MDKKLDELYAAFEELLNSSKDFEEFKENIKLCDKHIQYNYLKREIEYMTERIVILQRLKRYYNKGNSLPLGCFYLNSGYHSNYYESRILDGRWHPKDTTNVDNKDCTSWFDLQQGLGDAESEDVETTILLMVQNLFVEEP